MTRTILLTLGRLPKGLELARTLGAAGCKVLVADSFDTHLSKPSSSVAKSFKVTAPNQHLDRYLDDLLQIVDDECVDTVIPISEEALYVSLLTPHLPSSTTLFGAPLATLRRLHDKMKFQEQARMAGLATTPTVYASDDAARDIMESGDWVLKPALSCGGVGVSFFEKGQHLDNGERARSGVVQKRIYGREISSLTVAREGRAIGTVLYEGLVRSGTVATCFGRVDDAPAAEQWIADFVAHQQYSGFIGFDFIIDSTGKPWPIECNPRMTSGVHFMAHEDLAACILNDRPPARVRFKEARRLQEGHTTLLEAYGAIFQPKLFVERMGYVLSTPDILWSLQDPGPFFLMTPMSWPVLKQVMFKGRSFGEATTRDIEWRADIAKAAKRTLHSPPAPREPVSFEARVLDEAAP